MSRVRRLSIRGIRNFGDETELPAIHFSRPLTLILGPNGTGKTTIIEALKFATTGDFPPGSSNGKSFIHDPMLTKSASVRGVIKAEVVNNQGELLTICRTIESTRFETKVKFKTLDSSVSRINKRTGQKIMLSNRCADVDAEVVLAMGVSKPILNYVIFCHQEDFNWPLDEGKKLKERFDQIFDTARFNKALECIRKLSKDLQTEIRSLKAEKDMCKVVLTETETKEEKLNNFNKRLENSKKKIQAIMSELEPIGQKINEMHNMEKKYGELQMEKGKKKMEYNLLQQQIENLRASIQEIYEGTMEELSKEVISYRDVVTKKNDEVAKLEGRWHQIIAEESNLTNRLANQRVTVGTLRQQVQDQEKRITSRNKILNDALSAWNLDIVGTDVTELEVAAFTKRLEEKMRELECIIKQKMLEQEQEEKQLQREVDLSRTEKSKIESEMTMKENEIVDTRKEISRVRAEIEQAGAAANKLNIIESKLEQANDKIDTLSKSLDADLLKTEIQEATKKQEETEVTFIQVDEEVTALQRQSSLQAELQLHKSALVIKEKEIQKLKQKHESNIKMLLRTTELPQKKLKDKVDHTQRILIDRIKNLNLNIQTEQRHTTTLETTVKHTEQELEMKIAKLESDKKKISSLCHYEDYNETLLLLSKTIKDLQDKRGMYAYQGIAYKEYLKQLNEKNPCCPLCHRGFQSANNVKELIAEMKGEIEKYPNHLKSCEAELKIQQQKYDALQQLKPIVERVARVERVELKQIRENLEETKKKSVESRKKVEQLRILSVDPENKLTICKDMIGDIALWDQYSDEITKLNHVMIDIKTRLSDAGVNTDRTIQEAQTERELLGQSSKEIRKHIESLQSILNTYNEKLQHTKEARNALFEEQLKIQSEMQKLKQLRDKQKELYTREISLGESVRNLRQKLVTADGQLETTVRLLDEAKKEHRQKQESNRKIMIEGARRLYELSKIQSDVDTFVCHKIAETLISAERQMEGYQKSSNKLKHDKNDLEKKISKIKEDISRQEIRKRELIDNMTLRQKQKEAVGLQRHVVELKETLSEMNYEQLMQEWKKLRDQEERLLREKNIAKGNQEEIEQNIEQLKKELKEEIYRLARVNYKNKCVDLTVQQESILNLKAYSKVLDSAMIEYHEERMFTVNKIIKRMWNLVYTGTDTTAIQIRTEATEGVGDRRRVYNYKLVQEKHGVEMDMKGRCSAGQKVLASIIIRMALAETFCKDCGVLALDEPTTNLDEENTSSLADALSTVVRIRSRHQKNFQLIVISHDEKFLLKLAKLNNNKGFYELHRFENGLTGIKHCSMEQHSMTVVKDEESSVEEIDEYPDNLRRESRQREYTEGKLKTAGSARRRRYGRADSEESDKERPSKKRQVNWL